MRRDPDRVRYYRDNFHPNDAERWATRKRRLKAVFDGRCQRMDEARDAGWPPTPETSRTYSRASVAYMQARREWRAFRGWY